MLDVLQVNSSARTGFLTVNLARRDCLTNVRLRAVGFDILDCNVGDLYVRCFVRLATVEHIDNDAVLNVVQGETIPSHITDDCLLGTSNGLDPRCLGGFCVVAVAEGDILYDIAAANRSN